MVAKERGGEDSAWEEEQKTREPGEGRDSVGGWKESDGGEMHEEQLAEVVEVEEEAQILIQQNHDPIQEDEAMKEGEKTADVGTEAGRQEVDAHSSSYCEKKPDQRQSAGSYSEKERRGLAPPPAGAEEEFQEEEEEGADDRGAPGFTTHRTFFSIIFRNEAAVLPLTHPLFDHSSQCFH